MTTHDTNAEYSSALKRCRDVFAAKLEDYGASWRIMRPEAITDQLFIKRIRTLQTTGVSKVDEGIVPEFIGIVNYGIVGVIQLRLGYADSKDISKERALELYDSIAGEAHSLMTAKNHDYGEAWRSMRVLSFDDLILTKIELHRPDSNESDAHQRNRRPQGCDQGVGRHRCELLRYGKLCHFRTDKTQR